MHGRPRQDEPDAESGAPEWMVTFSDCMTLLLTFFVLLLSFSSFDDKVFPKMQSAFTSGFSSITLQFREADEALRLTPRIIHDENPNLGSEVPTPDGQYESNPSTSLDFINFQNQKVFLIPSNRVFLGRGTRISRHGRQMLTDVATLLKAVSNRIVITEHALDSSNASEQIGLTRAWIVTQFLVENSGLEKSRFSISSAGTTDAATLRNSGLLALNRRTKRVLEIVILERSTYN